MFAQWSKSRVLFWVVVFAVAIAASFAAGECTGQRSMLRRASVELDGTQAMLAFNRIHDELRLSSLLSRGCIAAAARALDISQDQNKVVLADFLNGTLSPSDRKYMSDRDPNMVRDLKAFKSKYGRTWTEPACNDDVSASPKQ